MVQPRDLATGWVNLDRIPGFHRRCPKRNVMAAVVYLELGLVLLSVPGMV